MLSVVHIDGRMCSETETNTLALATDFLVKIGSGDLKGIMPKLRQLLIKKVGETKISRLEDLICRIDSLICNKELFNKDVAVGTMVAHNLNSRLRRLRSEEERSRRFLASIAQ